MFPNPTKIKNALKLLSQAAESPMVDQIDLMSGLAQVAAISKKTHDRVRIKSAILWREHEKKSSSE